MTYGRSTSQYLEADVMSRPREWLVPLIYEHIVSNLSRAKVQIEKGDYEGKATSLQKAADLVYELLGTLDREKGGELADRLASLYSFLGAEIMAVGRSLDVHYLQRLIAIVSELHEAWVHAAEEVAPRGRSTLASQNA